MRLRVPGVTHALVIVVLSAAALPASAAVILNNSSNGYYNAGLGTSLNTNGTNDPFPCDYLTCGDPTLSYLTAPNLSAAAGALGSWLGNSAPTGGAWSAGPVAIPGTWTVNDETAIAYAIDAQNGLTGLTLRLGVDNGIFVWLNGSYLFGARAPGGSSLGEYTFVLPNLGAGISYLQLLREDHGGATGYDIELTGRYLPTPVPEPATLALLGLGLAGLGLTRRRKLPLSLCG